MSDADLVHRAMQGDDSACEALVRQWSARIVGYLRGKVGRADVAEDLAQDVLLRAMRSLSTLADPARFGSWILSIAHHAATDWHRAKARTEVSLHRRDATPHDLICDRELPPEAQCERNETRQQVAHEMDQLPDKLREVIMIYYYDRVTYQDIAEMLGVSVATVNARLTQARALLRTRLATIRSAS